MFCDEVLERVEAIAAGELAVDERLAAHFQTCAGCTMTLEDAVDLERRLTARAVPPLPAHFAARTLTRLRRERWRGEVFVDTIFNVSLAMVLLAVVGLIGLVVEGSGFAAITRTARVGISQQVVNLARRAAPSLALYAGAAALMGGALGLWWWAERE